jgi:hypothetical protein
MVDSCLLFILLVKFVVIVAIMCVFVCC